MKKQYINKNFPHLFHGADYNPEQWIETKEVLREDMRMMREANCNEMTVGIFSWSTLEREEGKFDFSFLDEVIESVYSNGGRIILATPSGARPRWMTEKYSEVLRVDEYGRRMRFGGRENHCYTSPIYREKVEKINRLLAERYKSHPAIVAWHISNEYGGECYCPLCRSAFRNYLKEKYHDDIAELNRAYWTGFWSHTYTEFEQIEPPGPLGDTCVHGLNLDWRRFVSHQTLDFMKAEIAAVKSVCRDIPVTTNFMPGFYLLNYWDFAEELDIISWDSYPDWNSPKHLRTASDTAFWHDAFRSLKNRSFMLMESAPGTVNWKNVNKLKRPGMEKLAAIQAVAHGSDTVQYFQWRKSRGCVEKLHGAVVDHAGTGETRIFQEVKAIGNILKTIDEIAGTHRKARVAILYDWENRWALDDCRGFQKEKRYTETCLDYYEVLWKRAIAVDVVNSHGDFSNYDLLIAPMLYMTDRDTIDRLKAFVGNGGTLYATYLLGMVNETDLCYLGGFPAAELKEVFGIWNEEIDSLYAEDVGTVKTDEGEHYWYKDYCEIIHAKSARVLASYETDFYAGSPAFTKNRYGKGKAYYQAFRDTGAFKDRAVGNILKELKIFGEIPSAEKGLPAGLTAHARTDGTTTYLFIENYSQNTIENIPLGKSFIDMETGQECTDVTLQKYGVRILKSMSGY